MCGHRSVLTVVATGREWVQDIISMFVVLIKGSFPVSVSGSRPGTFFFFFFLSPPESC